MSILEVSHLKKVYTTRFGGQQVEALTDVSFTVEQGEFVAIMGESGSGKTTLLNILAALDRPTAGTVLLSGRDLAGVREKDIAAFRRDNLGFVFQDFNLLDTFSLRDNILLPLVLSGKKYPEMERRLAPLADTLGITQLLDKYPYEVSGGQKQRCAVAPARPGAGRRTHRRSGLPGRRQPHGPVQPDQPDRADGAHGHPLRFRRQPRRPGAVHPGRGGVPPAVPGGPGGRGDVPAHRPHPDPAGRRR